MLTIKTIPVGLLETNCYIAADDSTKEAFIIDPGGDYKKIQTVIEKHGFKPKAVINTHGHGDHIGANERWGLPVWIHRLDAEFLQDSSKNLSGSFGFFLKTKPASRLLEEGDILSVGKDTLEVIHTPGHTPGSICLKGAGFIFSGDTLFYEGIGRTDFPYGSQDDITRSIKDKLLKLGDNFVVYPGHGPSSTIGHERENNPFIHDLA